MLYKNTESIAIWIFIFYLGESYGQLKLKAVAGTTTAMTTVGNLFTDGHGFVCFAQYVEYNECN